MDRNRIHHIFVINEVEVSIPSSPNLTVYITNKNAVLLIKLNV